MDDNLSTETQSPNSGLLSDADVGIVSYEDAVGAPPASTTSPNYFAATPSGDSAPPLTVTPVPRAAPDTISYEQALGLPPQELSDADVGIVPPVSTASDVGQGAIAGLERGAAGLAGFAGDAQNAWNTVWDKAALGATHKAMDWTGYGPQAGTPERADFDQTWNAMGPGGASDQLLNAAHLPSADSLPTSQQVTSGIEGIAGPIYKPVTAYGRAAETAGEFVPAAALGPESLANKAMLGVAAPAAGTIAAQTVFPNSPLAGMVGAMAGGFGAAGALGAAEKAGQVAAPVVAKGLAAVGRPAMQEGLAGQRLLQGASDPAALRSNLAQPGADALIPGSQPTTFQLTGDQGLGQMERADSKVNPEAYLTRASDQNSARLAALPQPTGNPEAVSSHLSGQLDLLDQRTQQQIDTAKGNAQQQAAQIGTGAGPEAGGADLRNQIATANDAATKNERQLWNAVDPDGSLANSTNAITQANQKIYGSLTPEARAFAAPEEKTFSGLISSYNPVEPFKRIADLRSNLASAMRAERSTKGSTPAYARMSQLMGAVQGTINNAIEGRAAQEAHAVSRGALAPEDTMVARVRAQLQPDLDRFYAGRAASYDQGALTGTGGSSRARAPALAGSPGTGSQTAGRFAGPERNQGVPQAPSVPNFDDAAAARLKAASEATKTNKAIFNKGAVGQVMAPGGMKGDYRLPNSGVPAKVFPAGPNGYEAVRSYHAAAGSGPEATQAIQNAAMETLRSRLDSGGVLQQGALDSWKKQYGNSLRAMDEILPGFSSRFDDPATATTSMLNAQATRKAMLKQYQAGAVGKLIGAGSSDEVVNRVGTMMGAADRVSQMRTLVNRTANNPDAREGLRSAVASAMAKQFMSQTEAGTSGQAKISADKFKRMVADKMPVLSQVFSPEEISNFRSVAADLDRSNRSVSGSKIAGGSDTMQNAAQVAKHGHGGTPNSLIGAVFAGALAGHELGHGLPSIVHGAAVGGGLHVLATLRNAGIHDVQSLVSDALLNPDRARQYISRVPISDPEKRRVAGVLTRSLLASPTASQSQAIQRASGGRVEPTDAQKEAGNYQKDHVRFQGLDIAIENRKGSERSGVGKDGRRWSVKMPAAYGYIKGTVGADGDHVDCYLGSDPHADKVYVIDQRDAETKKFDEHKCMLGFPDQLSAVQTYKQGFSDGGGNARLAKVTPLSLEQFKTWVSSKAVQAPTKSSGFPTIEKPSITGPKPIPHRAFGGGLMGVGAGNGPLGVPSLINGSTKKAMMAPFATGGRVRSKEEDRRSILFALSLGKPK